jgi:glycosyltransferase involved in cell wall biosynthesis
VATPYYEPLGGSESAICYLMRQLVRRGHDVTLAANLLDGAGGTIDGVAHHPVDIIRDTTFFYTEKFDTIVVINAPAVCAPVKALSPASRMVFWAHALPDQTAMQALARNESGDHARAAIDLAVFVSAWQRAEIERAFGAFKAAAVIGNGIAPSFENMFASPEDILRAKQDRAAYTATPYRGLSVLVRAMEGLERDTRLDVFSSMRVYQSGDGDYAPLFEQARLNPAIALHGSVTQGELAQHLTGCAYLFYPSIFAETFCITAAEAMAAGMQIVATQVGALPETTMGAAALVPVMSSDGHTLVQDYRVAMRAQIDAFAADRQAWAERMYEQSRRASHMFNWSARADEWIRALGL